MINEQIVAAVIRKGIHHHIKIDSSHVYLTIENKENLCPFCGGKMKTKHMEDNTWQLNCNCEESIDYHTELDALLEGLNKMYDDIKLMWEKVEDYALNTYQDYFKSNILPEMAEQLNKDSEIIANIKTLKGVESASSGENDMPPQDS